MKSKTIALVTLLSLSGYSLAAGNPGGKVFYRYKDANGELVITNALPGDLARRGYEIIDNKGRLIQKVIGELEGAELDAMKQQQRTELKEQEKAKQQLEYDLSLLRRYSFVTDIEAEEKRKLAELNATLSIVKGNLNSVRAQLEAEYARAAEIERQGRPLPADLKQKIEDVEAAMISTEDLYKLRQQDIENATADYDKAIKRFEELQVLRGKVRPDS